jgi:hypothetical protein
LAAQVQICAATNIYLWLRKLRFVAAQIIICGCANKYLWLRKLLFVQPQIFTPPAKTRIAPQSHCFTRLLIAPIEIVAIFVPSLS